MRLVPEMKMLLGQKFRDNAKHVGDEDATCHQLFHHQEQGWAVAFLSMGQSGARIFLGGGQEHHYDYHHNIYLGTSFWPMPSIVEKRMPCFFSQSI